MSLIALRRGFGLDLKKPTSRQIMTVLRWMVPMLFGPPLVLIVAAAYPFLIRDRTLYLFAGGSLFFFFLFSFVTFRHDRSLPKFPLLFRIMARFGWALASTAFVWGFIGIVNGLGTPLESRAVPAVAKHPTKERDPARRTYYIAVRPWQGSRTVVELQGQRATYVQLRVPVDVIDTPQTVLDNMSDKGQVTLVVGRGRLGLEWLKSIDPISSPPESRF